MLSCLLTYSNAILWENSLVITVCCESTVKDIFSNILQITEVVDICVQPCIAESYSFAPPSPSLKIVKDDYVGVANKSASSNNFLSKVLEKDVNYTSAINEQPQLDTSWSPSMQHVSNEASLPAVQMEDYLNTKMRLAQIMRDFNNRKICFIGKDSSQIYLTQYQNISNRVKQGEDIATFLKGKLVVFVTGVDKKKRSITETKLFIPDFEIIVNNKQL